MRRADRLFEIIQLLRSRNLTTAKWLSERLEISERTIYRDIQDLISSGVPIDGVAGMGYVLHKDYDLPPLMFNLAEITSLIIGIQMAISLGGQVSRAAEQSLAKINQVLPKDLRCTFQNTRIYTPCWNTQETLGDVIAALNNAIQHNTPLNIQYQKLQQEAIEHRVIYPLGIFFWQDRWTLAAWCTLRDQFRHFRVDRIHAMQTLDVQFKLQSHQTLQAFFRHVTEA